MLQLNVREFSIIFFFIFVAATHFDRIRCFKLKIHFFTILLNAISFFTQWLKHNDYGILQFLNNTYSYSNIKAIQEHLTLFLPAMGEISPYMSVTWPSPVEIGLN